MQPSQSMGFPPQENAGLGGARPSGRLPFGQSSGEGGFGQQDNATMGINRSDLEGGHGDQSYDPYASPSSGAHYPPPGSQEAPYSALEDKIIIGVGVLLLVILMLMFVFWAFFY